MDALIGAVHDGLVSPLEIEGIDERFAQAPVLEFGAPGVEVPALRARGRVVGQNVLLYAALLDGGEIVARRPDARGEFLAKEIVLAGEPLEGDIAVAVELVADDVEIVGS